MKFKFVELIKKNIIYLVSLILSFMLWFYILSSEPLVLEKELSVKYLVPKGKALSSPVPKTVTAILKGPRAFMRNLEQKKIEMVILVATHENEYLIKFKEGEIPLPLGVRLDKITPEVLNVELSPKKSKIVKVVPSFIGEVENTQKLVESSVIPKKAKISGPKELIDTITEVETEGVELQNLRGDGEISLNINKKDPRIEYHVESQIKLKYKLRPTQANLKLEKLKIRFISSRKILNPSHRFATLQVLSDYKDNNEIPVKEISVFADIPEDKTGRLTVNLEVKLPEKLHLLGVTPKAIQLSVR